MKRRSFLIGAGGVLAAGGAAHAQTTSSTPVAGATAAPATPAATPAAATPAGPADPAFGPVRPGVVRVNMQTGEGLIVIDLEQEKAPATVANFLRYLDARRFDNTTIYRASRPPGATDFGVVQGGYRGPALFPAVRHEPTTTTGLTHTNGAISMGRLAPGTARADWFVCVSDQLYLDAVKAGDPPRPGEDGLGYACFGYVVQGMDIVRRILAMPTGGRAEVPSMQGQILTRPIPVTTVRRAPVTPA